MLYHYLGINSYSIEISDSSEAIKGDPIDNPEYPSFIFSSTPCLFLPETSTQTPLWFPCLY